LVARTALSFFLRVSGQLWDRTTPLFFFAPLYLILGEEKGKKGDCDDDRSSTDHSRGDRLFDQHSVSSSFTCHRVFSPLSLKKRRAHPFGSTRSFSARQMS
jgi:hypothetical protein